MTTTAMQPQNLGGSFLQKGPESVEERPRRRGGKNLSWATDDKLCQVRLFVAEDAPSLSGTELQEFYQAKQTKFMHAAVPVSLDDLPPGFEGIAAKRARLDAESIASMVPQISWQCPAKFVLNLSWQVAAGEESTEVAKQGQREVRVLEAVYPRASAIPPSPSEAQELPQEVDETLIPSIPLVPIEDDEEGMEEDSLQTVAMSGIAPLSDGLDSQGTDVSPTQAPSPQDSQRVCSGTTVIAKDSTGLDASFIKDADLNVAAAAAAAYAAVKATESGRMIDHELLIKILSNPLLIEALSLASQKFKNSTVESITNPNRLGCNNNNPNTNNEQFGGFSVSQNIPASQAMFLTLPAVHEGQKPIFNPEGKSLKGTHLVPQGLLAFNGGGASMQERAFTQVSAHEQSAGMAGAISQNGSFGINSQPYSQPASGQQMMPQVAAAASARTLPPRQDYLKELIQQHGVVKVNNEAQVRLGFPTSAPPDERNRNSTGERIRAMGVGPRVEPSNKWIGAPEHVHSGSLATKTSRDDTIVHDRLGGLNTEGRVRPWKQCIYFNTPRGCRNGANCTFLHEVIMEKKPERTRTDTHPQQVKRPKVESGAAEVK